MEELVDSGFFVSQHCQRVSVHLRNICFKYMYILRSICMEHGVYMRFGCD